MGDCVCMFKVYVLNLTLSLVPSMWLILCDLWLVLLPSCLPYLLGAIDFIVCKLKGTPGLVDSVYPEVTIYIGNSNSFA